MESTRLWNFFNMACGITELFCQNIDLSKGNKTVPEKVATTRTEDGLKQTTKTSTTV